MTETEFSDEGALHRALHSIIREKNYRSIDDLGIIVDSAVDLPPVTHKGGISSFKLEVFAGKISCFKVVEGLICIIDTENQDFFKQLPLKIGQSVTVFMLSYDLSSNAIICLEEATFSLKQEIKKRLWGLCIEIVTTQVSDSVFLYGGPNNRTKNAVQKFTEMLWVNFRMK